MVIINIKAVRKERGMAQFELANAIGLSRPRLNLLENAKTELIPFKILNRLCIVLECEPGELLLYSPD